VEILRETERGGGLGNGLALRLGDASRGGMAAHLALGRVPGGGPDAVAREQDRLVGERPGVHE
jgi:hypothetical protein